MSHSPLLHAITLSVFPGMFPGPLGQSLAGKALEKGIWSLTSLDLRDFATDKHRSVDDSPYGGGTGLVMKPDVLGRALDHAKSLLPGATLIYPSPRGIKMTQAFVQELVSGNRHKATGANHLPPDTSPLPSNSIILLCGRFEGIDQRVIDHYNLLEVSLGDFILSGGEIAALALLDAAVRLLPGVIGNEEAILKESFGGHENFAGLLEYPHYTRPLDWNGRTVPDVLLSGDHKKIDEWRLAQAKEITQARRPEMMKRAERSD